MERIFTLQNLNCANCASVIEEKLIQLESVSAATFTIGTKQLRITSTLEEMVLWWYHLYERRKKQSKMIMTMNTMQVYLP